MIEGHRSEEQRTGERSTLEREPNEEYLPLMCMVGGLLLLPLLASGPASAAVENDETEENKDGGRFVVILISIIIIIPRMRPLLRLTTVKLLRPFLCFLFFCL